MDTNIRSKEKLKFPRRKRNEANLGLPCGRQKLLTRLLPNPRFGPKGLLKL